MNRCEIHYLVIVCVTESYILHRDNKTRLYLTEAVNTITLIRDIELLYMGLHFGS